jgi:beta-fructofuranosidase
VCIYQCFDDDLDRWVPLAENPVISVDAAGSRASAQYPECVIFDPSGWQEGDTYYALIGNKNHRPGYEGDSTSLFKSHDLVNWTYVGPFYKSDRRWTDEIEDCACSDFFPFGDKHMLLMHTHQPYGKCQYYIGRYENEQFYPEQHGQLSWLGSMLAGPETLVDPKGRRIFMGWIKDARDWEITGWTGVMTLPWHFYPGPDNGLKIAPVQELEVLRYDEAKVSDLTLHSGDEVALDALSSDCMEVRMTLSPHDASEFGIKLLCSPDGEEETIVAYNAQKGEFVIDFGHSSTDPLLAYPQNTTRQVVPYSCDAGELDLDIFCDRSVIEIFVNSDVVLVQRVYPTRDDSRQFKVFAQDGSLAVTDIVRWEMDASNPW